MRKRILLLTLIVLPFAVNAQLISSFKGKREKIELKQKVLRVKQEKKENDKKPELWELRGENKSKSFENRLVDQNRKTDLKLESRLMQKQAFSSAGKQYRSVAETIAVLDSTVYEDAFMGVWYVETFQYDSRGNQIVNQDYEVEDGERIAGFRQENEYDSNDNLISDVAYYYGFGMWKTTYQYDSHGNKIQMIDYEWDLETENWKYYGKSCYGYDSNGNETLRSYEKWEDNAWTKDWKFEYARKANGLVDYYIEYAGGSEWEKANKGVHTYSVDGRDEIVATAVYVWNNTDWVLSQEKKYDYTYNAEGKETSYTATYKEVGSDGYKKESKYDVTYAGDTVTIVFYGVEENNWIESSKTEILDTDTHAFQAAYVWIDGDWSGLYKQEQALFVFSDEIKLVTTDFSWDDASKNWMNESMIEGIYNLYGYPLTEASYLWENGAWVNSQKIEVEYDGAVERYILSNWEDGAWVLSTKEEIEQGDNIAYDRTYYWKDSDWALDEINTYYYSDITLGVKPIIANASVSIYPNPVVEGFYVSGIQKKALLTILDLNGRTVSRQTIREGEFVSLKTVPQGIYLVKVNNNGKDIVRKILKK